MVVTQVRFLLLAGKEFLASITGFYSALYIRINAWPKYLLSAVLGVRWLQSLCDCHGGELMYVYEELQG